MINRKVDVTVHFIIPYKDHLTGTNCYFIHLYAVCMPFEEGSFLVFEDDGGTQHRFLTSNIAYVYEQEAARAE